MLIRVLVPDHKNMIRIFIQQFGVIDTAFQVPGIDEVRQFPLGIDLAIVSVLFAPALVVFRVAALKYHADLVPVRHQPRMVRVQHRSPQIGSRRKGFAAIVRPGQVELRGALPDGVPSHEEALADHCQRSARVRTAIQTPVVLGNPNRLRPSRAAIRGGGHLNVADVAMRDSAPRNVNRVAIIETERWPATGTNTRSDPHTLFKAQASVGRASDVQSRTFAAMISATQARQHTRCLWAKHSWCKIPAIPNRDRPERA